MATLRWDSHTQHNLAPSRRLLSAVLVLADIRFAATAVAFLALIGIGGILFPQVSEQTSSDPVSLDRWLDGQRATFGPATTWLYRLGIFDLLRSPWLDATLALLALSIIACTVRRFGPTWSAVRSPSKAVPDSYLDHARNRFATATRVEPENLEDVLRRRGYTVHRWSTPTGDWLFADRFAWSQLGTFLTHLAIVVLILAALVTHFTAFSARLFVPEGGSAPVFDVGHRPAVNLAVGSASATFSPSGGVDAFRSEVAITKNGEYVKSCVVTVTRPCSYDSLRVRQAAFFPYGADIEVREASTGRVVYRDTVALEGTTPAPRLTILDSSGGIVMDQFLVLTTTVQGIPGTTVAPMEGEAVWIGLVSSTGEEPPRLAIFGPGNSATPVRLLVPLGGSVAANGFVYQFSELDSWPAASIDGLPPGSGRSTESAPVVQLASAEGLAAGGADDSDVWITGIGPGSVRLAPGDVTRVGDFDYTFIAQRPFLGLEVTHDGGEALVWIGSALLIAGLCMTLWLPRRRLWARIDGDMLKLAGVAPRMANFTREMESIVEAAEGVQP